MRTLSLVLAALGLSSLVGLAAPSQLSTRQTAITIWDGTVVHVEAGEFQLPESRRRPTARRVTIPYYRLKSTSPTPASPVFLLAGGPGSSGIDLFKAEETHREAMFYRTIADVVMFDQRGGGHSRPEMHCSQTRQYPMDQPFDERRVRALVREALIECRDEHLRQGVDLAAYNTPENAADVNDLRVALGYKKITLIGGSYGSHLALHVMRQYPDTIDRVVMFGVEGPDHTWDSPTGMLNTLKRVADATEESSAFAGRIPEGGLLKTFERALAQLEAAPQSITVTDRGQTRTVTIDAAFVRRAWRRDAGRRGSPNTWPELIMAMDRGDFSAFGRRAIANRTIQLPDPMHVSMNCASGISETRRLRYEQDPARSILGDVNFEYEAPCDGWPVERLDASFHDNVVSDIPTLIVHGTWDMSTPLENAREVARTLTRSRLVEVTGGNHGALYNLYERWAPMRDRMRAFLTGHDADFPATIDDMKEIVFKTPSEVSK
jgi:pimeloyl-ACP methyl ester carboxylesterase